MDDNHLQPDEFQTSHDPATGEVLIRFSRQEQLQASVHLQPEQVSMLAARLVGYSGNRNLTPISAHSLRADQTFETVSYEFPPKPDGSLLFTFGLNLDGRLVTLPVLLDPKTVEALSVAVKGIMRRKDQS